jgi:hypothetical protein
MGGLQSYRKLENIYAKAHATITMMIDNAFTRMWAMIKD